MPWRIFCPCALTRMLSCTSIEPSVFTVISLSKERMRSCAEATAHRAKVTSSRPDRKRRLITTPLRVHGSLLQAALGFNRERTFRGNKRRRTSEKGRPKGRPASSLRRGNSLRGCAAAFHRFMFSGRNLYHRRQSGEVEHLLDLPRHAAQYQQCSCLLRVTNALRQRPQSVPVDGHQFSHVHNYTAVALNQIRYDTA